MHMQGTPATMQDNPTYDDVVDEVLVYLRRRARPAVGRRHRRPSASRSTRASASARRISTTSRCWPTAGRFHELGCPLLVGHSRKGFIAKVLGDKQADRTAGTIGVALALASQGVQILRVHDVAAVRQALLLFEAVGGIDGRELILDDG